MKGIVESLFQWMNTHAFHLFPGAIRDQPQRGDGDYRLDARLNAQQLRKLVVLAILYHNQYVPIKNYPKDLAMIADDVRVLPTELWMYGIENAGGALKKRDADFIWKSSLYAATGSITPKGIYFPLTQSYYMCPWVEDQGLREAVRIKKRRIPVTLAFDPRFPDEIFLVLDKGKRYEQCQLIGDKRAKLLGGRELWEIQAYIQREGMQEDADKDYQAQGTAQYLEDVQKILAEAQAAGDEAIAALGLSNAQRLRDVELNREADLEHERQQARDERYGPLAEPDQSLTVAPTVEPPSVPGKPTWNHLMRSSRIKSEDKNDGQ